MREPITIFVTSDRLYQKHAIVMLSSVKEVTTEPIRLYFLPGTQSERDTQTFLDRARHLVGDVRVLPQSTLDLPNSVSGFKHVSRQALGKFFIPGALPEDIERVLYLDTDMVVQKSLAPLFETDFDGRGLAAVENVDYDRWEIMPIDRDPGYFNSGLMLLDLVFWRQNSIIVQCLEALALYDKARKTADQEILNIVFSGNWKPLNPIWNCQVHKKEWLEAQGIHPEDAAIIHYTGSPKPWHYPRKVSKWDAPYRRAARKAAFPGASVFGYPIEDNWLRFRKR